ncbi:MAG: DUF763 domain-containing protein [Candidatus Omnitrophica bacterium]|nr:DUF763 domain-containing protein [Candidatus Omnitrophota bacterium]
MERNIVELPLHYGVAPKYLFERQKKILFEIGKIIIFEFGTEEFLKRLSNPIYFQALGCISGFDWHSSGVTTTVCHALKDVFNKNPEYGVFIFGGKGKNGLLTPQEIENNKFIEKKENYILISKLTSKIDNNCIQDGYRLYHHTIFIDRNGNWAVIQQGMNTNTRYARRYHWFNKTTNSKDKKFIIDPHSGIISMKKEKNVLNLVDKNCEKLQNNIIEFLNLENPDKLIKEIKSIQNESLSIFNTDKKLILPSHHYVESKFDIERLYKNFCKLKEKEINSFSDIILTENIGIKTLRALCLISEVIYGDFVSFNDPAKFSFAFGGKDGHPYPLDIKNYDRTISFLKEIIEKAKIKDKDKFETLKKLNYLCK